MNEAIDRIIQKTLLSLLKKKAYKEIQMKEIAECANIARRTLYRYYSGKDEIMEHIVSGLMDAFADTVNRVSRWDLEGIAYSFFLFWEEHIEELRLLETSHLMYLLSDNLPDRIREVSFKTKFKNLSRDEWQAAMNRMSAEDNYNFNYMIAGYFRVAQLWMEEKNKQTPEEMALLMRKIVLRELPGM